MINNAVGIRHNFFCTFGAFSTILRKKKKPALSDWLNAVYAAMAMGSMMDRRKIPSSTVIFRSPPYFSVRI